MLRWPHGGHGDCASARAGYGVRQWARPAGTRVGGRFTALQRQRCCRFEAFSPLLWCHGRCSERPKEARKPKTQVQHKMRSPTHWGGRSMPGDHAPTQGGAMGAVLGVLLRNYGFTDLPPSLPLPRSDPVTRISESSYRRACGVRDPPRRAAGAGAGSIGLFSIRRGACHAAVVRRPGSYVYRCRRPVLD